MFLVLFVVVIASAQTAVIEDESNCYPSCVDSRVPCNTKCQAGELAKGKKNEK